MAVREISTRLTLTGENSFSKAIREMNANLRQLDAEMKQAAASFDLTGDEEALLTSKSRILKDQIAQQEAIMKGLSQELQALAAAGETSGTRVDRLQRNLTNATTAALKFRKQAEDTDRELEELGRDTRRVGNQIEDNITDSAEDAKNALDDMISSIRTDVSSIQTSSAVSAFTNLGQSISTMWSSLDSFTTESREYRRSMSFLQQNAADAGISFETAKSMMMEVASYTGEVDSSVEGISNLLATGFDSSELEAAMEALVGAVIKFPDTLKFESLADGLQETVSTGSATGQFAELLERLGVDTEEFNDAMTNAETEAGRLQVALAYLSASGLSEVKKGYDEVNASLIAEQEAETKLQDAWANLGTVVSQYTTPVKSEFSDVLNAFTGMMQGMEGYDTANLAKELGDVETIVSGWAGDLGYAIGQGVAEALGWAAEKVQEAAEEAGLTRREFASEKGFWADLGQGAQQGAEALMSGFGQGIDAIFGQPYREVKKLVDQAIEKRDNLETTQDIGISSYDIGGATDLAPAVEEIESLKDLGVPAGEDIGSGIADGIAEQKAAVATAMDEIDALIDETVDKERTITIKTQLSSGSQLGGQTYSFNVDGKTLGTVVAPYVSTDIANGANYSLKINSR